MALISGAAGVVLAWHHPLWPGAALAIFALWCFVVACRPGVWLLVVPACLPFLNFSPWTGWLVFEEFDILLLGTLAGGYVRLAWSFYADATSGLKRLPPAFLGITVLLAASGLLALLRGFADAGGFSFDWFAGYTDPLNSLRVFKSLGFALMLIPLLQQELARARVLAGQRLATGMVLGLTVVALAVVWERAAFPGLFDFSEHYRTVALFWEMHVGGAAIDAYLALTSPFVVWALVAARRPLPWAGAAALALVVAYACSTTFSRGVYFAVAGSLVLLGLLLRAQRSGFELRVFLTSAWRRHGLGSWRGKAGLLLALALAAEVLAVGGGSFMSQRLSSTDRDLTGRLAHWRHGLGLLEGPAQWWLGKGLGRLPANYAARVPNGEFSGSVKRHEELGPGERPHDFVTVRGPATRPELGGLYALTQRVSAASSGPHWVGLEVRVTHEADLHLELCERHLLYDGRCQAAYVRVSPDATEWQALTLPLQGSTLTAKTWNASRLRLFSLSVGNAGGAVDVDNVHLIGSLGKELLENGSFTQGMAHWFPAAQAYFLPWHLDNLFLEVLVERGLAGLLILAALLVYAVGRLTTGRGRLLPLSPYLAASLCGALLLGAVSSLMDVPRVAFLFFLMAIYAIQTTQDVE
ncbi:hypothetical protein [Polaromonas sp. C04]|uniref:hypothetical protein n=1 Tax=Polaromonas sp. C04 TaxID=1945857 RepID=UPI001184ED4A|nr:hypothetical protein [Polaromonas sp. C04]